MPAKKSSKGKKVGRNKKNSKNERQHTRTEANKRKRINYQRALAGKVPYTLAEFASMRPLKTKAK